MPKSALTGTQKKAMKTLASEIRKAGGSRKEALRLAETFLPGQSRYKSTESKLLNALKQQEKYTSGSKQPYKGLEKFLSGGKAYEKGIPGESQLKKFLPGGDMYENPNFYKESQQGLKLAQKAFEPIQNQALMQYKQQTLPAIYGQFGREAGAGSSALNQALAASAANLQTNLGSQLGQLAMSYGSDISKMNLGERGRQEAQQFGAASELSRLGLGNLARQLEMQYGAAKDIFGAKRGADVGYGQSRQDIVSYLNQLGLGNAQALQKAGLPQVQGGFIAPYLQKQSQGTSGLGGTLIGGGLGALGSLLGSEAGSTALIGMLSSKEVKDNIRDYEKGLDVIRDMEVKQYDYTIPVAGNQTDRVGLIAEEVPQEIQTKIGDIKAIDVYGLVSILVNAVKQLDEKVKMLEAR